MIHETHTIATNSFGLQALVFDGKFASIVHWPGDIKPWHAEAREKRYALLGML